jgi:hypothetical protein
MTRNGKIARLPDDIREELNRRLERNVQGITLVEWLNSLPEVQEVLRDLFEGNPIIPQNLSQWRQGGFAEWQARKDLFDRARDAGTSADDLEKACRLIADRASQLLAARFAIALAEWDIRPDTSLQEDHDPALQDSPPSVPSVPSTISALKPLIPLARAISQLRRADRDLIRQKMDVYHFDRKRRADESSAALFARFRREDAEAAAAAATKTAAAPVPAAPPPAPPSATTIPGSAKSRSHPIKPLSSHNQKPRRAKTLPEKATSPAATPTDAPPTDLDWQMRNRPLPTDTPPAWRLPIKTIPPWQLPEQYEAPPPPKRARMGF